MKSQLVATLLGILILAPAACGDDADSLGVGAECATVDDCGEEQACLPFKGGYCGTVGCTGDSDCIEDSTCVAHDDGNNYCFRTCTDKSECNANRSAENEANCSSNVTFVDSANKGKACVPPS